MKLFKHSLFTLLMFTGFGLSAQVAINTTGNAPDSSAVLDLQSTTRGMLIPRMDSFQRESITTPATGLMVYDTDSNSFWFWNGSEWSEVGTSREWSLTGNIGTDTTNNFIGTTDDMPLDFKVNNQRVMRYQSATDSPNLIGGYSGNSITSEKKGAIIAGGGSAAEQNIITNDFSVISGGAANKAFGYISTVAGGKLNEASGNFSAIGGGFGNKTQGIAGTVSGGDSNEANGVYSSVGGGRNNLAGGDYSFASGRRAKIDADHDGSFLFSDQNNFDFNSATSNEFAVRSTGGVRFVTAIDGSGNPTKTVSIDTSGRLGIGTTSPETPLSLLGNGGTQPVGITQNQVGGSATLELTTTDTDGDQATRLLFRGSADTANIEFYSGARGSETATMFISGTDGNVGIGTITPSSALDVNGEVRIQGGNPAPGAHLVSTDDTGNAEWRLPSDDYFFERDETMYTFTNNSLYYVLQTTSMELKEGDYIEIMGQATGRIPSGSGIDIFDFRIVVGACEYYTENLLIQPDEDSNNHDNNVNLTLFTVYQAPYDCTAEINLEVKNSGDDDYTITNPRMSVRRIR